METKETPMVDFDWALSNAELRLLHEAGPDPASIQACAELLREQRGVI